MRCIRTGIGAVVVVAVCIAAALAESTAMAADAGPVRKWHPWFELGGYGSNEDSRGEAIVFAPLWQSSTALFFTDVRGKLFDEDDFEGNFALGLRVMRPSGWNLGAWVGWDARRTELDSTFDQVSFGLEAIRTGLDLRVNGYVPIDDDAIVSRTITPEALLTANSIFVQTTDTIVSEHALHGVDGEVGVRVPLERWFARRGGGETHAPRHELRLYGGGFWFENDVFDDEVAGPRARAEWRINDVFRPIAGSRLTIEAEYRHDDVRAHQFEGGARLRIPFGAPGRDARNAALAGLTGQERRMMDGLERDADIVVREKTDVTVTLEAAIDNETNVRFDRVAFVGGGGNLQATLNATGQNSLIIATGGTLAGNVATLADQTLQGGASTIFIRGARTGVVVPFTAPGTKPTLQVGGGLDVLTIGGNNVHIAGLGIDGLNGTSNAGIYGGNNRTNIVIQQNMITNIGFDGIDFDDGNSNVRIFDNMITKTGEDGVEFDNFNTGITIRDNRITQAGENAVDFDDNNSHILISGNLLETSGPRNGRDGVDLDFDNSYVTITGNTINTAGGAADADGVDLEDGNRHVTITNNIITIGSNIPDGDGIDIFDFNNGIVIANNTITVGSNNDDGDGIDIFDFNSGITIANNTITVGGNNDDGDGIDIVGGNTGITITGNTITVGDNNDDGDGIELFAANRTVLIANNIIRTGDNDNMADGIDLGFDNTDVVIRDNTIAPGNLGDGMNFGGPNQLLINDNLFNGPGFDEVFDFDFGGNIANGIGNRVAPGTGFNALCDGAGNFVGTLVVNGIALVNGGPPCI